jgi:hypothetical protein
MARTSIPRSRGGCAVDVIFRDPIGDACHRRRNTSGLCGCEAPRRSAQVSPASRRAPGSSRRIVMALFEGRWLHLVLRRFMARRDAGVPRECRVRPVRGLGGQQQDGAT